MSKIAVIECGHGKTINGNWDPGCVYGKLEEADLMLPITKAFVKYARLSGITVYSDSDNGNSRNGVPGVALANKVGADVFISIHCDYYKAPSGTMPLHHTNSEKGEKLAKCLNKYVEEYTGIGTRGVVKRKDLYELNATHMPACIFETGSIKHDNKKWDTVAECDAYGEALARGLCDYFDIPFKSEEKKRLKEDGIFGKDTVKRTQEILGTPVNGIVSGQLLRCKKYFKSIVPAAWEFKLYGKGSVMVGELQELVGAKKDKWMGKDTIVAMQKFLNEKGFKCAVTGKLNKSTVKAWQKYLNSL